MSTFNERFHRAARDGHVDLLRNANKRDLNTPDEDGMTPTLLASLCGNLEALRLIVGRGGDPDKCDIYGNSALHCAAYNGHINCVSFLVNYGINIWALDNEHHTAKDVAGNKNNDNILNFLDEELNKQTKINRKNVETLKEKAIKEAEKRIKDFDKIQAKAIKRAAKDDKKIEKEREKIVENGGVDERRPSVSLFALLRRDSQAIESKSYSDLVSKPGSGKKTTTGVSKKIQQQKSRTPRSPVEDFKVRELDTFGPPTIKSISGLRRGSDVMLVPKYDLSPGELSNGSGSGVGSQRNRASSIHQLFANENDAGIFDRPGFGNMAFRKNSINATMLSMSMDLNNGGGRKRPSLTGMENGDDNELGSAGEGSERDHSLGSGGSFHRRNRWPELYNDEDEDDLNDNSQVSALETFLTAHDLMPCFQYLRKEHIDLEALLLLKEEDLKEIGIPMGIRKKMIEAINRRKNILSDAGDVYDSRL